MARHSYYPFGQEATDPAQTDFALKFTGHERDANGPGSRGVLDYMHARHCSPVLGRFLSVDPAAESVDPTVPQAWNKYAYVRNNPLKLVDPDGEITAAAIADKVQETIAQVKEAATFGLSDGSIAGVTVATLVGTTADVASLLFEPLRAGEALGEAIGTGAGPLETAAAGVVDTLRAAAVAAPAMGAMRSLAVPRGIQTLSAPGGRKLAQQIGRFRAAGGTGGRPEFLKHVNDLSARAREAGNFVTGTVGRGPQAIPNATIFREGNTFIVVDRAGVVRSFVSNASPGGIVDEFLRLGGSL